MIPNLSSRDTLTNLRPGDAIVLQSPRRRLIVDSSAHYWLFSARGAHITPSGNYDFVTSAAGEVMLARTNTDWDYSTHLGLSDGQDVRFAGSIHFGNSKGTKRGTIIWWNNNSGHYQPPASMAGNAGLPMELFVEF